MHSMFLFIHLSFSYISPHSWLLPFDWLQEVYMELASKEQSYNRCSKAKHFVQTLVLWLSVLTTGKFARWKSGDHLFFFLFGLAIAQQQSCHLWSHAQHWPTIHLFWPSMNISTGFEMSRKKLHRKWPDREQTLPQVGRRLETSGFTLSGVKLQ